MLMPEFHTAAEPVVDDNCGDYRCEAVKRLFKDECYLEMT